MTPYTYEASLEDEDIYNCSVCQRNMFRADVSGCEACTRRKRIADYAGVRNLFVDRPTTFLQRITRELEDEAICYNLYPDERMPTSLIVAFLLGVVAAVVVVFG